MTTFTAPLAGTATSVAPAARLTEAFSAVRGSVREWRHAFQAAARTPDRTGMDYQVLLMFGRD